MKIILLSLFVSNMAFADMYYECVKVSESEPVNAVSGAPQKVNLDIADNYLLVINGRKVKFAVLNEDNGYLPVLQTERLFAGEMEVATLSFDGRKCDSLQMGHMTRMAQIGAPDVTESAEYDCTCGED